MRLKTTPELHSFLSAHFQDSDPGQDKETTKQYVKTASAEHLERLSSQAKLLLAAPQLPLDELGSEANRWFADQEEARDWLSTIVGVFAGAQSSESVVVKDSNGMPLNENDSVQVIKDLKVKGGSSDLKRGTLIKRIHLTDDPDAIECRVDGSMLVLKTCFLKKV
jgi:protein PhnA